MNLEFKVDKAIDDVFDILTDMHKFASVHPVIKKVDDLGAHKYRIYETLKFAFIPLSFTYPATVEHSQLENRVTMRAKVWNMVEIDMEFNLRGNGSKTIVEETVEFRSMLPVRQVMQRVFKKQHRLLFKNMEAL